MRPQPYFYRIVALLVTAIGPENILLRTQLERIENAQAAAILHCNGNRKYTAAAVVLAIPPHAIQKLHISPPWPHDIRPQTAAADEALRVTGFIVRFNTEFWTDTNASGSILRAASKLVAHRTSPATLTGLFFHDAAAASEAAASAGAEASTRERILRQLCARAPSTVHAVDWHEATWQQTACRGVPPSSASGRIVLSGTNAGHTYRGLSNGAVQGGWRGALLALLIVRPALVSAADVGRIQEACAMRRCGGNYWRRRRQAFNVLEAAHWAVGVPLVAAVVLAMWPRRAAIGGRLWTGGGFLWECVIKVLDCIP